MRIGKRLLAIAIILSMLLSGVSAMAELATLTLPAAIMIIDEEAFMDSTAIEKVVLPEGIQEIRARAFANSSLKEIGLPSTLTFIADDVFENTAIETVTAEEGTYAYNWAVRNGYIKVPLTASVSCSASEADIGDTVTWTANAVGGTAPYQYAFELYCGGRPVAQAPASSGTTFSHTIEAAGTYHMHVTVTDVNNTIENMDGGLLSVVAPLSVEFVDSPIAPTLGGSASWTVALHAKAEPAQVAFRLYKGDELVDSTDYASNLTYSHVLAESGSYRLAAVAKDAEGSTVEAVSDAIIVKADLTLALSASAETADPGDTVIWTAVGGGGTSPYAYAFRLYRDGELIQSTNYSRTRTYSYSFETGGSYYVLATMTDADGDAIAVPSEELIVDNELTLSIAASADVLRKGEAVTWTASAHGGTEPYQYAFRITDAEGTVVDSAAASSAATFTHVFDEMGEYHLSASVTDAMGDTAQTGDIALDVRSSLRLVFTEAPVTVKTGTEFTWTVEASGGVEPYRYAFHLFSDGELVDETEFGDSPSYKRTFEESGAFTLLALMTDAEGNTVQELCEGITASNFTLTVTASAASAVPDDTVTWTAQGDGGKQPYQYSFDLYRDEELAESTGLSDADTYSFTFVKAGNYYVLARIVDDSGDVLEARSEILQVLMENLVIDDITDPTSSYSIIRAYTWTANAHGGEKPYQYQFVLTSGGTTLYTRNYSTKSTFSYTFFDAGSYTLTVNVKDALGNYADAYSETFSVASSNVVIQGLVRIYLDLDANGNVKTSSTGHYEIQINNSNGMEIAFGDRVYKNPCISYRSTNGSGTPAIVDIHDGDGVFRPNSRLYTWTFSSSVAALKDFLINQMQNTYLRMDTEVISEDRNSYNINGPFATYNLPSNNCFGATAIWTQWLDTDSSTRDILFNEYKNASSYTAYIAPAMYAKYGHAWTYVGELRS